MTWVRDRLLEHSLCPTCGRVDCLDEHPADLPVPPLEPNRFDPYEALDTIGIRLSHIIKVSGGGLDTDGIRDGLHALRAYITGMER